MTAVLTMIALWCGQPTAKQVQGGISRDDNVLMTKIQQCRTQMLSCMSAPLNLISDSQIKACAVAQVLPLQ